MTLTIPRLVSVNIVEEFPEITDVKIELNIPVLLVVVQFTVPVGLDPYTAAVQVTAEPAKAGLGEQETKTVDCVFPSESKA
jgi:hypothetical protein